MKQKNRLRVLRAEKRWSQLDVATRAKFKEYRYWRIENGYEIPTDDELDRLARLFEVRASEIFPTLSQVSA